MLVYVDVHGALSLRCGSVVREIGVGGANGKVSQ